MYSYRQYLCRGIFLVFALLLQALSATFTQAAAITVTSLQDSGAGTLRQAVVDAGPEDTINFNLSGSGPWTITLASEITILKNLTLNGPGSSQLEIAQGGTGRVFHLGNIVVHMSGLTVKGGNVTGDGGGILLGSGCSLTLNQCSIGENNATYGAGIYIADGGTLSMTGTTIESNNASLYGGGIYAASNAILSIDQSTITQNQAGDATNGYGGGLYLYQAGSSTIDNTTIINNTSTLNGGGIYWMAADNDKTLSLTGCDIDNNQTVEGKGGQGGGLCADMGGVILTRCNIRNNAASHYGGGISSNKLDSGLVVLTDCTFSGNSAGSHEGGGASLSWTLIQGCLFENNEAGGYGGGLHLIRAKARLLNTTVHGNRADLGGGGLFIYFTVDGAKVSMSYVTITGNYSDYDCTSDCSGYSGGGISLLSAPEIVLLKSCIIAENHESRDPLKPQLNSNLSAGTYTSAGYNFIGLIGLATGFSNGVNHDQVGGIGSSLYPKLYDLGDYGGSTWSRPPEPGSLAIGAGGPALDADGGVVASDQRGNSRPPAGTDAGACEVFPGLAFMGMLLMK